MRSTSLRVLLLASLTGHGFAQGFVVGPPWSGARACGDVNADGRSDGTVYDGAANVQRVVDGATGAYLPYLQRTGGGVYVGVGDHDGDGCDDLAHHDPTTIVIVSGRDGSTLSTFATGLIAAVAGADVDGDGRSDLLLEESAPATFPPPPAFLKAVSARSGAVLWQQSVGGPLAGFTARGLRPIGDENGDGREDVVFDVTVSVGTPTSHTQLVRGPATNLTLGTWRPIGDVDGDGTVDALVQTPSLAWSVVASGTGATLWAPTLVFPTVVPLQDVDGDGHADFFLLDPLAGIAASVRSGATFLPLPGFVPAAPPDHPFSMGDVDGDGRHEFVVGLTTQQWVDPSLPAASRLLRRGTAGTTHDGRRPKVIARGHAGLGNTVHLDVRGALPNGAALVAFGAAADVDLAPFGAPGNRSYTTLDSLLLLNTDQHGIATLSVTVPVAPSLLGAAVSAQAAAVDGTANAFGFVTSNAIDVTTSN